MLKKLFKFLKRIFWEDAEKVEVNDLGKLLGLNKSLNFPLTKVKVKDDSDFKFTTQDARCDLIKLVEMLGFKFKEIDPDLADHLRGTIGSMCIFADSSGNMYIKFHKRDEKFIWDDVSDTYPEKDLSSRAKYFEEVMFLMLDKK